MKNENSFGHSFFGVPKRRWFEYDTKRRFALPVNRNVARERLASILDTKRDNSSSSLAWMGTIENFDLEINLTIILGRGKLNVQVFASIIDYPNGCLVEMIMRDSIPWSFVMTTGFLVLLVYVTAGLGLSIIAALFFGSFLFFGAVLYHGMSITKSTSFLSDVVCGREIR
ncbi:hypothetical protein EXU57_24760 [Segetibacter sp. 3557_3]|uniref:hypothetical protein n=1 Tax=Segetibacter sp. 3557_3 TaxID=2547429 RepID=UPI00105912A8|nr:hypothetical protein [Segetibacter sp. 3557_3]TDH17805.1 hypothetical protein EXU57_24760 [Segetibacter sp. 3557_3]